MTTRTELEDEWREFQLWRQGVSLEFSAYLEHRDLVIAKENLETLKEFINDMEDSETITIEQLKDVLRFA